MILQDPTSIRHYQKITDGMVNLYRRRYSFEEIRLYMDGYIACLRNNDLIEQFHLPKLKWKQKPIIGKQQELAPIALSN